MDYITLAGINVSCFYVVYSLLIIDIVNAFKVCYNLNIKMTAQIMTEVKATINADI